MLSDAAAPVEGGSCKAEGPANLNSAVKDMNGADFKLPDHKGKVFS